MSKSGFIKRCLLGFVVAILAAFVPARGENPVTPVSNSLPKASAAVVPAVKPSEKPVLSKIRPVVVTLALGNGMSQDMEIIQWPDGSISLPVRAMAALFGIDSILSDAGQTLFFIDPLTHNKIALDLDKSLATVNGLALDAQKHSVIRNSNGLLVPDDVYLDQSAFAKLFDTTFSYDNDTTTLTMASKRHLKLSTATLDDNNPLTAEVNTLVIRNPEIVRNVFEKLSVQSTSTYRRQETLPATTGANASLYTLMDTPVLKLSGSLFGQDYYVQPSLVHYNNKLTFQNIDWSIQHVFQKHVLSLGSGDAGLSPLVSPSLNVWGLKLASHNALTPILNSKSEYEFSGKAVTGNQVTITVNNRTVQTVSSRDDSYEFEPVSLEPQTLNHIRIVEKDNQNQEKVLVDKTIPSFRNLLPRGEYAYSGFAGRRPVSFYPLLGNGSTPLFLPQSEKWLTGGRVFYGLADRLTVGVSGSADHIWGQPKTYYGNLNPFSVNLNGFTSYLRDPNFLNGENLAVTLRYQFTNRWLLSLDGGMSHYSLKPGSLLSSMPQSSIGKALRMHLERQSKYVTWFAEAFHYDPYYYTPSVNLYGNSLYDRQGVGTGFQGSVSKIPGLSYHIALNHFRTNLEHLIPGGTINANSLEGNVNMRLGERSNANLSVSGTRGLNQNREFLQKNIDLSLQTKALPWGMTGELRTSHYYTNTIFYPSQTTGALTSRSPYGNNILYTSLDIPLLHLKNQHIKVGNQMSTFFNDWFIQGGFQYKKIFFEPLLQRSYGDRPQTQNRMGVRLGYEFKSGARFSVSYYKSDSAFNLLAANTKQSSNSTHQFYFDFTDIFGMLGKRPHSLGPNAESQSVLSGAVFVDYYADGKRVKSEPGVHAIKLMLDKQTVVMTDKNGAYLVSGLSEGYHTLEVLPDDLPLTLSVDNPIYKIKLKSGKVHRVNIPLLPEGGVVKGHFSLVDTEGKVLKPKNMILVLTQANGQIANYTTVNDDGTYKFSNIPTGKYRVDLEEKSKESGRYRLLKSPSELHLDIPKTYEAINEVLHQDFEVLAL